jgi:NAD+ kinase
MKRILVLGNAQRPGVAEEAGRLLPLFRAHAEVVHVDLLQETDLSGIDAELCVVLGGDGAIIRAARQMGRRQVPVLGVNLGRLGFLADITCDEVCDAFPRIVKGGYRVTEHLMFEAVLHMSGQPPAPPALGFNEVAVQAGPPFHMLDLDLFVDGEAVARYSGDGLIISTPVGSTAHSLSAGGPILSQELSAFVVTPICAHGLTSRPVVDCADKEYTVEVGRGGNTCWLVIDGQQAFQLAEGARISLRKSDVKFRLARAAGRSFYKTLHDKLHWGTQPAYRSEPPRPAPRTEGITPHSTG